MTTNKDFATLELLASAPANPSSDPQDIRRLQDLSATQWKSGAAAWLGWLFDGLDMHLYTLVAAPFVAQLLAVSERDTSVGWYSSIIQAAFLVGWALGGGFFGRIGDRMGRSRGDVDDLDLRPVHRPVVLRPDLVAFNDLPLPGGPGHWG